MQGDLYLDVVWGSPLGADPETEAGDEAVRLAPLPRHVCVGISS